MPSAVDIKTRAKARLLLIEREEAKKKALVKYQQDPLLYFRERLGICPETIDWDLMPEYKQRTYDGTPNPFMAILNGLAAGKWVGVESATGTGKTFNGAMIVLWFLECFPNSIVVTTAPKQEQLSLHIWKEISKLYPKFGTGYLTQLKLRMNEGKDDWIATGFVAGIDASEESATRAQGFHAEHMLIIFEETPGVPLPIINAFFNTCTGPHNLILAFGNPDSQNDNLHRFCMLNNVKHVRISSYDHPNVVLNNSSFIPGACSKESIARIESRYGKEHPLAMSRTRGISPAQSVDSLIQLDWCLRAADRFNIIKEPKGEKALGVDVANSIDGDKAAIAYGVGNTCLSIKDFQCPDSNQLGKREVATLIKQEKIKPELVGVDGVGVGAGTVNGLKELKYDVKSLIGSESPVKQPGEEQFNNLRSQMYWQLREDLRNDLINIPNDTDLFADLTVPKWITRNGMIVVESKEEIKKRLGHSPNKGDALVYWNWVRGHRFKPTMKVYSY